MLRLHRPRRLWSLTFDDIKNLCLKLYKGLQLLPISLQILQDNAMMRENGAITWERVMIIRHQRAGDVGLQLIIHGTNKRRDLGYVVRRLARDLKRWVTGGGSVVPDTAGGAALLKDVNGGECVFGNEVLCGSKAGGAGADDSDGPDGVGGHDLL